MKFSDFILADSIITELNATTKEGVVREMVQSLYKAGGVPETETENIITAIMKREELGTTGVGHGTAVPHTKHSSVDRLVGTIAISTEGVDFDSLDCEKVNLFFLLVSPPDRPGEHLRALEHISIQLKDEAFCRYMKQSHKREDILALLDEADGKGNGN